MEAAQENEQLETSGNLHQKYQTRSKTSGDQAAPQETLALPDKFLFDERTVEGAAVKLFKFSRATSWSGTLAPSWKDSQ